MGDETLSDARAMGESEEVASVKSESTYSIITYTGVRLPENYRGFIFSKWLRSLRHGNDLYKLIEPEAYYKAYTTYITNLLARAGTAVRLAVISDAKDVVLGFAVHHDPMPVGYHEKTPYECILDYIYVQPDFRLSGIATSLLEKSNIDAFTHVTRTGLTIWNNKFKDWKFNPFA